MILSLTAVIVVIGIALLFDFLNGFHDAANSIATVVSTRVLSPAQAVIWAALFNFIAAFVFGTPVAKTIAKDLINPDIMQTDQIVLVAGLIGAIVWNIITWLLGLPTSSSHALIGGLAGAAITARGIPGTLVAAGWIKTIAFLFLSPMIGFVLGGINMIAVSWIFRRSTPGWVDKLFRRLQLVSAGLYSLGHGTNDAQKTMGIIVAIVAVNYPHWAYKHFDPASKDNAISWWIILSCHAAMGLGTVFGGWRIVKTMGSSITRLTPVGGCCAEIAGATTIIGAAVSGIPVSTTHAITGAILGVGTTHGVRSVRWIWGQRIVMAWVLTIPCAAFVAAITYMIIHAVR
jgi:inorganic phosphate transporter, PiT family